MKQALAIILAFAAIPTLRAAEPGQEANWQKFSALGTTIKNVRVISGTQLQIAGIGCRLLGIQLPDEPATAALAKRFLELYIEDYGSGLAIYNAHWPINDKDGIPLIWLSGIGNGGWAQEALVQAGLAKVDYQGFETYKFNVPKKEAGNDNFDWKQCLKDAEASFRHGRKPNVNFRWPEAR